MKAALSWLSPGGARGRLSVLIFHRVLAAPDPLFPDEVDVKRFDDICRWLAGWFTVLPLDDALRRLQDGQLPAGAAAITFDDGYADNQELALPILQRHGLCATFFIATGYLDGGWMWNDGLIDIARRVPAGELDLRDQEAFGTLPPMPVLDPATRARAASTMIGALKYLPVPQRDAVVADLRGRLGLAAQGSPMLQSGQVRALRQAGMGIGAHTVTHPILATLDAPSARAEMAAGRTRLEDLLQERVGLFAYPNGRPGEDYSPETVSIARDLGFDAALTTAWGAARRKTDRFQIPRFSPWDRGRTRYGLRLALNLWRS